MNVLCDKDEISELFGLLFRTSMGSNACLQIKIAQQLSRPGNSIRKRYAIDATHFLGQQIGRDDLPRLRERGSMRKFEKNGIQISNEE